MYLANALNLALFEEIIQGIPISRVAPFGRGVLGGSSSVSVIWTGMACSAAVDVVVVESPISTSSGGCTDCRMVSVDPFRRGVNGRTTSAADVLGIAFLFPFTVAEGEGSLSTLVLVEITDAVDLRFAPVVGVIFLITVFLGGGTGGVEVVEVVDRVDGVGEALRGLGDGGASSIDDVAVVRLPFTERFDAADALRARIGDFDGEVGEVTPSEVLAVLTLVVEALEIAETVLVLVTDWTVELLLPADEGPSDAVLNVEDASLLVETRELGLETGFLALSPGALVLVSAFEAGTDRSVEARDLTEAAEDLDRSPGLLDTLLRDVLPSTGVLRLS